MTADTPQLENAENLDAVPATEAELAADLDQTVFVAQEPLLEGVQSPPPDPSVKQEQPPQANRVRVLLGVSLVLLMIVGVGAWVLWPRDEVVSQQATPEPTFQPAEVKESLLKSGIILYDSELKKADPAQPDVLFPALSAPITLEVEQ